MSRLSKHLLLAGAASFALLAQAPLEAQDRPLRIIVFGAHPDDCDDDAGGTAALWAAKGHQVKFVALTNGDAGNSRIHSAGQRAGSGAAGCPADREGHCEYRQFGCHQRRVERQ